MDFTWKKLILIITVESYSRFCFSAREIENLFSNCSLRFPGKSSMIDLDYFSIQQLWVYFYYEIKKIGNYLLLSQYIMGPFPIGTFVKRHGVQLTDWLRQRFILYHLANVTAASIKIERWDARTEFYFTCFIIHYIYTFLWLLFRGFFGFILTFEPQID